MRLTREREVGIGLDRVAEVGVSLTRTAEVGIALSRVSESGMALNRTPGVPMVFLARVREQPTVILTRVAED